MTDNIVDLATERRQRRLLAEGIAEGGEAFVDGLQRAGQTFAKLGWHLAAPVQAHDRMLTNAIYQLALQRLDQIIGKALPEVPPLSSTLALSGRVAEGVGPRPVVA